MELGPKIGDGRTAEVFVWGEGRVLKLFRADWGRAVAESEASLARRLYDAGVPSPAIYGVVQYADRFGVIYERITGASILDLLLADPDAVVPLAQQLAETHAALSTRHFTDLPTTRQRLAEDLNAAGREGGPLPADVREQALRALAALPDGTALSHGDYHPGNVLLSDRGPLVIDWENVRAGDPAADVARAELLILVGPLYIPATIGARHTADVVATLLANYLQRYEQLTGIGEAAIAPWRLPIAAARLREGIEQEMPFMLERIRVLAASHS
jgi:aminoglycoside phosphotransferase (APT) family kinase protein